MNKLIILLLLPFIVFSQHSFNKGKPETSDHNLDINDNIRGTLWLPDQVVQPPLVIMLTGSGPNDRDGNSPMTRNDSHKQLAQALLDNQIATYRYDKRIVTQIKNNDIDPDLIFDDFVQDARDVVSYFANDQRFSKLIIAGHSQGSLVGMLAVNNHVDGFISLAGAGEVIDHVIIKQIAAQSPGLDQIARDTFNQMRSQDSLVSKVNPYLESIQGKHIQPFMKSWMSYDPSQVIAQLDIPTLIINGDRDNQVPIEQAQMLDAAAVNSKLVIINDMNHVLKKVSKDDLEAAKSYNDPSFAIHPELIASLTSFILD